MELGLGRLLVQESNGTARAWTYFANYFGHMTLKIVVLAKFS